MHRRARNPHKTFSKTAFLLLALSLVLLAGPPSGAGEGRNAKARPALEWQGNESNKSGHFIGVISDREQWRALWKEAFGKKAPRVDFTKKAVACVFLGHDPGWWYSINILDPRESGSTVVIPYELVSLVVEIGGGNDGGIIGKRYGRRGQYRMRVVDRKPETPMTMQMAGQPEVPPHFSP